MEKIELDITENPLATKNSRHMDCCYYQIQSDICWNDTLPINREETGFIPNCAKCQEYNNKPWDGLNYFQIWNLLKYPKQFFTPKQEKEAYENLQKYLKWIRVKIQEMKEKNKKEKKESWWQK